MLDKCVGVGYKLLTDYNITPDISMALKPITPKSRGRSPLQRPVAVPFAPAYVKKTKSSGGFWIFLLLAAMGGAFYYVYTHQAQPQAPAAPKVIVIGNPEHATKGTDKNATEAPKPKKTALGTVGTPE